MLNRLIQHSTFVFLSFLLAISITISASASQSPIPENPYLIKYRAFVSKFQKKRKLPLQSSSYEQLQNAAATSMRAPVSLLEKREESSRLETVNSEQSLADLQLSDKQLEEAFQSLEHARISGTYTHKKNEHRPKGMADPCFPYRLQTKPSYVLLPPALQHKLKDRPPDAPIKIKYIPAEFLENLTSSELKLLIEHFNKIPMKIKWRDNKGHVHSGSKQASLQVTYWHQSNAVGALALHVGIQKNARLLTDMLVLAPDPITFALQGKAAAVIDVNVAAKALIEILAKMSPHNTRQVASSAESIAQIYIGYWAEEDADQLILALTRLVMESAKMMNRLEKPFSLKQKGVLLGAILAGSMAHAQKIKSKDEHRLWVINSISNLAWATTTFIGAIPVAGSLSSAIAGTLSIGVIVWAVIYNKIGVRDFTPKIREIEGHIEFSALEIAEGADHREKIVDILETLAWMRAAIHVNGFFD